MAARDLDAHTGSYYSAELDTPFDSTGEALSAASPMLPHASSWCPSGPILDAWSFASYATVAEESPLQRELGTDSRHLF